MSTTFTDDEGFEYTAYREGDQLVITRTDCDPPIEAKLRVVPLPAYEPAFVVPEPESVEAL